MDVTKETIEISWNRIYRLVELTSAYVFRDEFTMGYMNFIVERSIAISELIYAHMPSLEKMKDRLIEMIVKGKDSDGISIGTAWRRYCYLMNLIYNFIVILKNNNDDMNREIANIRSIEYGYSDECDCVEILSPFITN